MNSRLIHQWLRTTMILFMMALTGCTALKKCAYEGFNRNEWQHPEQVIEELNIQPGEHVADLGSGSGYFTFRLAKTVGPTGIIYAVDVDQEMNAYVAQRAHEEGYENIEVILAERDDPKLSETGVDLVFTCNTYHHLEDRVSYFSSLARSIKKNGRVAILDFNGEGWLEQFGDHWTAAEIIKQEMKQAGYTLEKDLKFLPRQIFMIFSVTRE